MTDAIIISLIAAAVILIAMGIIDYKIGKLERLMHSYKIEIGDNFSHYYNLLNTRIISFTAELAIINSKIYKFLSALNDRDDKMVEAMKILTDVTKENTDRIDCMHEYLNMFDDTVITTIRDNYNDTREIKDIFNKINEQTGGASLEYTDENFRKMLGVNSKGE